MKVYLSGAMTGRTKEEMEGWRQEFIYKWCSLGYTVDNPLTRVNVNNPVEADLNALKDCGALVLYHLGPSDGSAMELMQAKKEYAKTIVIDTTGIMSPWIIYHADHIVKTIDEAVEILHNKK